MQMTDAAGKRRWRARSPKPAGSSATAVCAKRHGVRNASSALARKRLTTI